MSWIEFSDFNALRGRRERGAPALMMWRERFGIALQSLAIFTVALIGLALGYGLLFLIYESLFR